LRNLILGAREPASRLCIKVFSQGASVLGYYHALDVDDCFFLNYIAVVPGARGMGLGKRLLADFEESGRALGFGTAGLDAFASNPDVADWYIRSGYTLQEVRYHVRVDLRAVTDNRPIEWALENWNQAVADEQRQGFSKLPARVGRSDVELGLIDGCAVKLLSWQGIGLEECVAAIASVFAGERSELIISGLQQLPYGLPYIAAEQVLRLTRSLSWIC
jgi:ribosomal protein S18 acetylase RimI-like enzyme